MNQYQTIVEAVKRIKSVENKTVNITSIFESKMDKCIFFMQKLANIALDRNKYMTIQGIFIFLYTYRKTI